MQDHSRLKLRDVRRIFRLIGELREMGSEPGQWRPHLVTGLRRMVEAEIVVSSEIHIRKSSTTGKLRVIDIGWGCDADERVWQIQSEQEDVTPEMYWLLAGHPEAGTEPSADQLVPVRPVQPMHEGTCFILSQYPLPHAGAVDQLGLHRSSGDRPFTRAEHRLVRLFHVELGRLWRRDALKRTKDPTTDLPPRLSQTLSSLLEGLSEKQIALRLELSQHTIHNYVKALHQRFEVSSRGELLAKAGKVRATFLPQLSLDPPKNPV